MRLSIDSLLKQRKDYHFYDMELSTANVFMGMISPAPVVRRSASVSGSGHRQRAENTNSRDSYLGIVSLPHQPVWKW